MVSLVGCKEEYAFLNSYISKSILNIYLQNNYSYLYLGMSSHLFNRHFVLVVPATINEQIYKTM